MDAVCLLVITLQIPTGKWNVHGKAIVDKREFARNSASRKMYTEKELRKRKIVFCMAVRKLFKARIILFESQVQCSASVCNCAVLVVLVFVVVCLQLLLVVFLLFLLVFV